MVHRVTAEKADLRKNIFNKDLRLLHACGISLRYFSKRLFPQPYALIKAVLLLLFCLFCFFRNSMQEKEGDLFL